MNAFFGLDTLRIDAVTDNPDAIRVDTTLTSRPPCPHCDQHTHVTLHGGGRLFTVHDTPSRGRPTLLTVKRRRYRCEACLGRPTFSDRGADIDERWKATRRLVAYVENAVTNHPLAHVARDTGLPATTVRKIALELSKRLEAGHRFPTPRALASDGLKIGRQEYTVFAEAWTGRPIGIIETQRGGRARPWVRDHLDVNAVRVFVSDLHKTNINLAASVLWKAQHVADRWHVVRRYQKPLGRIIDQEIDRLRKTGASDDKKLARELYELKPALLAIDHKKRKTRKKQRQPQHVLQFDAFRNVLAKLGRVRRAYWARYDLAAFYHSTSEAEASWRLGLMRQRVADFHDLPEMKAFLRFFDAHQTQIFNYFGHLRPRWDGKFRGPTTNALEQRNSTILKAWRSSHGIRSLALIRLRVLYEPWVMGTEIVACAEPGCEVFLGPLLGPPCPAAIRDASGVAPRCLAHAV